MNSNKPQPYWDPDYPGIPYCSVKCPYYGYSYLEDFGYVKEHCALWKNYPELPDPCWECAICLPALAEGRKNL